jgi:hypothetical protein
LYGRMAGTQRVVLHGRMAGTQTHHQSWVMWAWLVTWYCFHKHLRVRLAADIMGDCYKKPVLKTLKNLWRRCVLNFYKELRPVKLCQILIMLLLLHKLKEVAFYNVCLNLILHLLSFLGWYPNLGDNFCRILTSLWKMYRFLCYGFC